MLDAGDAAGAVDLCTSTLKLFRGGVLPGAGDGEWVDPHRARLEEAQQTGSIDYVDFITAGVVVMTVVSGIAYPALRLSTDLQKGIISRFRTMPVAPSSVLSGQALSSTLSNLFSCFLVVMVAFLVGFRPDADATAWLSFVGLLVLFILATTWLTMLFGLLAKTPAGAGAFSYILLLLIFISPSFVPTDSMSPVLRASPRTSR